MKKISGEKLPSWLKNIDAKLKKINFKKILKWTKIIGVSVLIACSIFYGYLFFKYFMVTNFTAILFIFVSGFFIWVILRLIIKIFKIRPAHIRRLKFACVTLLVIWFCAEAYLRIAKINVSKNERNGLYYTSGFKINRNFDSKNPHLFVNTPNASFIDKQDEFSYKNDCNSDGLRDCNHSIEKERDEYRIICIGNSFTEGVGAPQDSTWPKLLEDKLKLQSKRKISVFNAGKSGSDSFFGYMLLKERLLKYKPDMVLLAIGFTDVQFYRFRGGFERFTKDGYKYREAPAWEQLYALSYICRFITNDIMQYDHFLSPDEYKVEAVRAVRAINDCIEQFYKLAISEHFKLIVVFFDPEKKGSEQGKFYVNGKLPYLNIIQSTERKNIPFIALSKYNRNVEKLSPSAYQSYYWPINQHPTSKGYDLIARGVEWNLKKMGVLDSILDNLLPVISISK